MNGADDRAAFDALQVDARDPEVGVAELALDHDQRHPFVRHLNCLSMSQLMRREPPSDTGRGGLVMQLLARSRRLPPAAGSRAVAMNSSRRGSSPRWPTGRTQ